MPDDLKDVIKDAAEGPESAEVDGVRTKQHSLDQLIKADKHLASRGVSSDPAGSTCPSPCHKSPRRGLSSRLLLELKRGNCAWHTSRA